MGSSSTFEFDRRASQSGKDLDKFIAVLEMTNKPNFLQARLQHPPEIENRSLANNDCDGFESYMDNTRRRVSLEETNKTTNSAEAQNTIDYPFQNLLDMRKNWETFTVGRKASTVQLDIFKKFVAIDKG